MKYLRFLLVICFAMTSATCGKRKGPCHHFITIKNNSNSTVIVAGKGQYGNTDSCTLGGRKVPAHGSIKYTFRHCAESIFSNGYTYHRYFVSPASYNAYRGLFDCDSIYKRYNILKEYNLTIEDLNDMNFTITYQ